MLRSRLKGRSEQRPSKATPVWCLANSTTAVGLSVVSRRLTTVSTAGLAASRRSLGFSSQTATSQEGQSSCPVGRYASDFGSLACVACSDAHALGVITSLEPTSCLFSRPTSSLACVAVASTRSSDAVASCSRRLRLQSGFLVAKLFWSQAYEVPGCLSRRVEGFASSSVATGIFGFSLASSCSPRRMGPMVGCISTAVAGFIAVTVITPPV